ncbi:general secretion pathway protein GspC [Leptospira sp. GIMC2001]|uniref:general secretion pathway protein GspC n=1 Tax=Leptospira sp. GIMC2001 TaxID=1513297 RepID=UPI00234B0E1F|nr:general secretion pathway protein GspC [Leptospira sp. GIMC2001]WCL47934.1 general secretion pathway protein GspC [Leptospira sp. GIMC2001]
MNIYLARLQNNKFYTLIPVVLLFTYALAYLVRMILIVFFNSGVQTLSAPYKARLQKSETLKSLSFYEEAITGNLIRGMYLDPTQERSISGVSDGMSSEAAEDPDIDQMVVTGTVSGDSSFARVTIREKNGITEEYAIGEEIGGFRVRSIEQHYIILQKSKFKLKVLIGESIAQAKEKIKDKMPDEAPAQLTSSQTIQKTLSREDVNKKLKDPNVIYKDAKFGPHLVDGKIEGYKLYQVARSHFFYSLGARSGDIIKRVNGMPLNDTEKMLEIYGSIKTAQKITIDLDRKSKIISYEFLITN